METWKEIKGYENIYEASSYGRIRTCEGKITESIRHGTRLWKQRVLKYKGYTVKTGYRVTLWKNKKSKDFLVARLIAFTFFDKNINNRKLTVNHKDGNRLNNNIENLELISLADNIRHGFETGLYSSSKKTIITNLQTKEQKEFYSMSKACLWLGKNTGFISGYRMKNKTNFIIYDQYLIEVKI